MRETCLRYQSGQDRKAFRFKFITSLPLSRLEIMRGSRLNIIKCIETRSKTKQDILKWNLSPQLS